MIELKIWGSRGSVPVSGTRFVRHGGATSCVEVRLPLAGRDHDLFLVDCGTGIAELGRQQRAPTAGIILQSHLHWDHIQGFPFFGPLWRDDARFEMWSVARQGADLQSTLDDQMTQPTFPVGMDLLRAKLVFRQLDEIGRVSFGDTVVSWTEMAHPGGSSAFRFDHRGRSVVVTGDAEVGAGCRQRLVAFATGADVLVMDAQYTSAELEARRGFGHSSTDEAVDVAIAAEVGQLLLTHHDPGHDDETLDAMLAHARQLARGRLQIDNARDGLFLQLAEQATTRPIVVRQQHNALST